FLFNLPVSVLREKDSRRRKWRISGVRRHCAQILRMRRLKLQRLDSIVAFRRVERLSGTGSGAFDFNPDAGGLGNSRELLDADAGAADAPILKAGGGDSFGQGFDKVEVTCRDDGLDPVHHRLIADDIGEMVAMRGLAYGQIDIDPDGLRAAFFVLID